MTISDEQRGKHPAARSRPRNDPASPDAATSPPVTPDGRYIVVRGRLWRRANPQLDAEQRTALTAELMDARRAVGQALRADDLTALGLARARVNAAKIALGERGPVWWTDGAPDQNRRLARNTDYAAWYALLESAS